MRRQNKYLYWHEIIWRFPSFSSFHTGQVTTIRLWLPGWKTLGGIAVIPSEFQQMVSLHLHPFFLPKRVKLEITPKKGKTTWGINRKLEPASELGSGMRSGSWKRFLGPLTTRLVDLSLFANPPQPSSLPLVIWAPPNEIYGLQYTELWG